jgi:outer membrane lipoprotein-sorting protein
MKTFVNTAALAGALIVVFATVSADLNAADIDKTVREHQAAVTDLSANASAVTYWVSESDGWHVVTTVDTLIREHGNAEHHAVVRSPRCYYQASPS